jgi:chromate transporter
VATFVGYKVSGILGALVATIAIFLPSAIILCVILAVYRYFIKSNKNTQISNYAKGFISGVKPAIVGFLISATIILAINPGVLITHSLVISLIKALLVIVSFILLILLQISPVWLVFGGAAVGLVLTRIGFKV